eukprot:2188605-Pyramimonas_sp.AAC.1
MPTRKRGLPHLTRNGSATPHQPHQPSQLQPIKMKLLSSQFSATFGTVQRSLECGLGTLTTDIAKAVKLAKQGQVEFRGDKSAIIHAAVGKVTAVTKYSHDGPVGYFARAFYYSKWSVVRLYPRFLRLIGPS